MEKVIIFCFATVSGDFSYLENQYNEWIKENPNVDIIRRESSTCTVQALGPGMHNELIPCVTISVFYKEK